MDDEYLACLGLPLLIMLIPLIMERIEAWLKRMLSRYDRQATHTLRRAATNSAPAQDRQVG